MVASSEAMTCVVGIRKEYPRHSALVVGHAKMYATLAGFPYAWVAGVFHLVGHIVRASLNIQWTFVSRAPTLGVTQNINENAL